MRNSLQTLLRSYFGSQLRMNMLSGVVAMFINLVILAVTYPLYLHFLGYERYGVWLLLSVVFNFAQLGLLGIKTTVTKLVAQEYSRGDHDALQSYMAISFGILTVTGLAAFLILICFENWILSLLSLTGDNEQIARHLLPYTAILVVYVFFVQAYSSILAGLGRMDLTNYILVASRGGSAGLSVLFLALGWGVTGMLLSQAVYFVLIHVLSYAYTRKRVRLHLFQKANFHLARFKHILSFGGSVFGGSLLSMFLDPFNKAILSRYVGVESIPIYDISFRSAYQMRSILEAALRAMMPEISRLSTGFTSEALGRIRSINWKAMKIILVGGAPFFLAVFLFSELFLKVWLRTSFVPELVPCFRIMLAATYFSILGVPSYYTLMGMGRPQQCLFSTLILALMNVILVFAYLYFSPPLEVLEVSIAVCCAMVGSTIYLFYQKHKTVIGWIRTV